MQQEDEETLKYNNKQTNKNEIRIKNRQYCGTSDKGHSERGQSKSTILVQNNHQKRTTTLQRTKKDGVLYSEISPCAKWKVVTHELKDYKLNFCSFFSGTIINFLP